MKFGYIIICLVLALFVFGCSKASNTAGGAVRTVTQNPGVPDGFNDASLSSSHTCSDCDFNKDNLVNAADLAILSGNYGATGCSYPSWCNKTDINQDTTVNGADLAIFSAHYGENCTNTSNNLTLASMGITQTGLNNALINSTYTCADCDFNKDNVVNAADLAILSSHYGDTGCSYPSWCNETDINMDSTVNGVDVSIFSTHYGENCKNTTNNLTLSSMGITPTSLDKALTTSTYTCSDCDFNNDKLVNGADLAILSSHYGDTGCSYPSWCNKTDINHDTNVNGIDLSILTVHYGENCTNSTS